MAGEEKAVIFSPQRLGQGTQAPDTHPVAVPTKSGCSPHPTFGQSKLPYQVGRLGSPRLGPIPLSSSYASHCPSPEQGMFSFHAMPMNCPPTAVISGYHPEGPLSSGTSSLIHQRGDSRVHQLIDSKCVPDWVGRGHPEMTWVISTDGEGMVSGVVN